MRSSAPRGPISISRKIPPTDSSVSLATSSAALRSALVQKLILVGRTFLSKKELVSLARASWSMGLPGCVLLICWTRWLRPSASVSPAKTFAPFGALMPGAEKSVSLPGILSKRGVLGSNPRGVLPIYASILAFKISFLEPATFSSPAYFCMKGYTYFWSQPCRSLLTEGSGLPPDKTLTNWKLNHSSATARGPLERLSLLYAFCISRCSTSSYWLNFLPGILL